MTDDVMYTGDAIASLAKCQLKTVGKSRNRSFSFIDSLAVAKMRSHLGAFMAFLCRRYHLHCPVSLVVLLRFAEIYLVAKAYLLGITIFRPVVSSASTCDHDTCDLNVNELGCGSIAHQGYGKRGSEHEATAELSARPRTCHHVRAIR